MILSGQYNTTTWLDNLLIATHNNKVVTIMGFFYI